MKKLFFAVAAPLLLLSQSAFAALPPLWQGVREMEAILKSDQLKEHFVSADQIQEISKIDDDSYFVRGNRVSCIVNVIFLPSQNFGPAQFTLNFVAVEQQQ